MKKILLTASIAFITSIATGAILTSNMDGLGTHWRSDGSSQFPNATEARVGTETSPQRSGFVMPFLLPTLPSGETISDVSLTYNITGINYFGGDAATGVYLDLLAPRTTASSTANTAATDTYSDTVAFGGTILADGMYEMNNSVTTGEKIINLSSLTSYIQNIYTNDINAAGKYVFLTLAPDVGYGSNSRYLKIATDNFDQNIASLPVLTITTAIPEPGTMALVLLSLGGLLLFRRRL
ncbi:PEP-CTERM sorting domain-containing protein [Kiritimatiellaeota bacterium B1221]|nr:PEP-CTERM sorting domain-containing protein [Kiritimatiellaeota bacterium B1221]